MCGIDAVASLEFDSKSGRFLARFRYGKKEFKRSLRTENPKEARALLGRIEYTVQLIERGELEIPVEADAATFIVTGGKKTGDENQRVERLTLSALFDAYFAQMPEGSKELSTIKTERLHQKNLLRHLKGSMSAESMTVATVQGYVQKRAKDKFRGKYIRPDTIKLELTTLRLIWNWALSQGLLSGRSPVRGIKYAKPDEKPPFVTFAEIERTVARGGISDEEVEGLWESLYLTRSEVKELLDEVRVGDEAGRQAAFVYPMFVFVAHTGARRSEILRSRIDDFNFESETVVIREKKKSKSKATTYRRVAMTRLLKSVMADWFARHPGGQLTIAGEGQSGVKTLSKDELHNHFKKALATSPKWSRIPGFHTFRHSFISILAAASVDQRVIDEFVGHTTEEMRRRYRHLFPDTRRRAIQTLEDGCIAG